MWTLELDVLGLTPTTKIVTYEVGHGMTTPVNLDKLVYRIYTRDNLLMFVDNTHITAYDYKCVPSTRISPVLVYGWQFSQSRAVSGDYWVLLLPGPDETGLYNLRSIRLLGKSNDLRLYLPEVCHNAVLGSRYIYAFSSDWVYTTRYGQTRFTPHALPFSIQDLLCVLDGDRAVVSTVSGVYLLNLPRE